MEGYRTPEDFLQSPLPNIEHVEHYETLRFLNALAISGEVGRRNTEIMKSAAEEVPITPKGEALRLEKNALIAHFLPEVWQAYEKMRSDRPGALMVNRPELGQKGWICPNELVATAQQLKTWEELLTYFYKNQYDTFSAGVEEWQKGREYLLDDNFDEEDKETANFGRLEVIVKATNKTTIKELIADGVGTAGRVEWGLAKVVPSVFYRQTGLLISGEQMKEVITGSIRPLAQRLSLGSIEMLGLYLHAMSPNSVTKSFKPEDFYFSQSLNNALQLEIDPQKLALIKAFAEEGEREFQIGERQFTGCPAAFAMLEDSSIVARQFAEFTDIFDTYCLPRLEQIQLIAS